MTTIETKIAKNGAINFYNAETGKRVKEADVVMDAIENGGTYYTAYVHGYNVDHVCTKEFASPITAYKWICRMARKNTTYADGDAQIIVGFNGEEIYTQKMSTAAIKNDELRAYVEAEEAPYVAESLRQERENQIVLQMSHRNITREQAEELVDYLSANRKNYSNEVAATVKAMLDNFKKINNPEPAIVDATIETKIAKNETLICKFNGKRASWANTLNVFEANAIGTVITGNGHSYTCINDNEPAPERLTYETGYLFEDENGNRYIFDNSAFAIRAIAYNNVDEYAVTQDATVEAETAIVETANVEEPDGYNPDVFSLLPKLEDLNDVDGEFDEDAAEYTDRNDRYNRGEKIAADLTAKLRTVDPTVEVTFTIDDDEDTYYLSYDGIIRTPFTATSVELSFHAMKQSEAKPEDADYMRSIEIVKLYRIKEAAKNALAETAAMYKGALELGDTEIFAKLGNERKEHHKAIIACTKRLRELGAIPEPKAPTPAPADVKKVSAVVYYTCTDDKSNWAKDKYFETTPAAAEWILSFVKTRVFDCTVRDAEIIDRRNGYVRYTLTDADITAVNAVNTEPELPTPKPDSPFAIARGLDDVFQKTFHKVGAPYLDVTTQDGAKIVTNFGAAYISVDWRAVDGYVFGNHFNDVLARYETPEQVTDVMTALRDAIKAGKTEFAFPTVDDFTAKLAALDAAIEANQPAEVKALNAELDASTLQAPCMWIRIVDGAGNHRSSFSGGSLSAVHIEYNAEPEAIKGYTLRYFDEPMELYDTFAQVNAAVEQFKAAIISNAETFTFPTVEALTPEEPAPVVEETDYEKFLKASEYVITSPGRYLGIDKFGKDRFATKWATLCPYRKINKATARNILATFGLTPETYLAEKAKWVAAEIARGSRQFAIDMQAEFLRDKIDADRKASVEPMPALYPSDDSDDDDELIDPPVEPVISKEQLIDSLERAMTTALEKFQGFCLVKNLTAAENELKFYNICRLATRELWR